MNTTPSNESILIVTHPLGEITEMRPFSSYLIIIVAIHIASMTSPQAEANQEHKAKLLLAQITGVQQLAKQARFIQAVKQQNAQQLPLATIKERDTQWIKSDDSDPLKASMAASDIGAYLKNLIRHNASKYNEVFLTDSQGANIAAYPLTSDYWQGDEDKFIKAYADGSGDIYIGEMRFDESTQTNAVQISVPVIYNGNAIGVLVMGVKVDHIIAEKLGTSQ